MIHEEEKKHICDLEIMIDKYSIAMAVLQTPFLQQQQTTTIGLSK